MKKVILPLSLLAVLIVIFLFWDKSPTSKEESLTIKGSDTEVQLVSNLVEAFLEKNPRANISVTGGGSGVGIASLLNGEIDLANSSRAMEEKELEQAKEKKLEVGEFILSIDGLSIIVHSESEVPQLSIDQLAKIYQGEITDWKEVGGAQGKIVLYGRQSTSGTYTFFRNFVVKDDYAPSMRSMEGNQAIVDSVISDKNGIGYVGVGYVKYENNQPRNDLKVLSISGEAGKAISPLDGEAVKKGEYPITRPIFQYLPRLPQKDSLLEKFLRFETSKEGQEIIEKAGFFPINKEQEEKNQQLLEKK
ncbi:MAG: PstS family phosphate ABC transporter substrate-binding protein [Candidatus Paceibacterota bacterium]